MVDELGGKLGKNASGSFSFALSAPAFLGDNWSRICSGSFIKDRELVHVGCWDPERVEIEGLYLGYDEICYSMYALAV